MTWRYRRVVLPLAAPATGPLQCLVVSGADSGTPLTVPAHAALCQPEAVLMRVLSCTCLF